VIPPSFVLRRLVVKKARDVVEGTTLDFGLGLNLLLGRNGSGKTTCLEIIAGLLSFDDTRLPFALQVEAEYRETGSQGTIALTLERYLDPSSLLATDIDDDGEDEYRTVVRGRIEIPGREPADFSWDGAKGMLGETEIKTRPDQLRLFIGMAFGYTRAGLKVQRRNGGPHPIPPINPGNPALTELAPTPRVDRHDEGLTLLNLALTESHITIELREGAQSRARASGAEGLSAHLARAIPNVAELVPNLAPIDLAELGLGELPGRLGATSGRFELRSERLERLRGTYRAELFFRFPDESERRWEQLSYGERRLVSLSWYLAANPSAVCLDEPVNGLHHAWLDWLMGEIERRPQAFVATQNPLLLDYVNFTSEEQIRDGIILCSREVEGPGARTRLRWRHPTDVEASKMFDAVAAGIQYVSEILIMQGLW
jgi:energy-coupling factor transporter ATP-binding protein EcfA2